MSSCKFENIMKVTIYMNLKIIINSFGFLDTVFESKFSKDWFDLDKIGWEKVRYVFLHVILGVKKQMFS